MSGVAAVYFLMGFLCGGMAIGFTVQRIERGEPLWGAYVSLNSQCPACGHRGCSLRFMGSVVAPMGDKGTLVEVKPAMIQRTCNVCGATSQEKPVLPDSLSLYK